LIDKRRHSNILDVRSFRGADCDTDHYLVVAKLRGRISVSKRARQYFDLERFDLKKLDDVEVKKKYQVEISNRFAALESLDESFDINNAWESIRENIKISAKENLGYQKLKLNKPWFDDECVLWSVSSCVTNCHLGFSLASSVSGCVWVCVCPGLYAILVFPRF
jgi:hypothetical protein